MTAVLFKNKIHRPDHPDHEKDIWSAVSLEVYLAGQGKSREDAIESLKRSYVMNHWLYHNKSAPNSVTAFDWQMLTPFDYWETYRQYKEEGLHEMYFEFDPDEVVREMNISFD